MSHHFRKYFLFVSLYAISCGGKATNTSEATGSSTAGPSTGDQTSVDSTTSSAQTESETSSESTEGPTTEEPTTTTGEPTTTTDDPTCWFQSAECSLPDMAPASECNIYEEDCGEGQKCMPWADGGGSSWNALKCVEVQGDGMHGDPCTVEGSGVSGMDDCAVHHMCWGVDSETLMGHCIAFCDGSPEDPSCGPPNTMCVIANEGVLNICLPSCDPLLQDCPEDQGCYPVNNSYACAPSSVPDNSGFEGEPCDFINNCQPGFACTEAEQLLNCNMSNKCCTPFCDLNAQDPCPNPETQCIAMYEDNLDYPHVGFCGAMP